MWDDENQTKHGALFWLNKSKVKSGKKAPIYIRVTISGSHREISLGEKIAPEHWDGKSKRLKKAEPLFRSINSKIIQTEVDINRHFNALQTQGARITPEMIKNAYLGKTETKAKQEQSEKGKDTILYAFDEFIFRFQKMVDKGLGPYYKLG